MQEKITRSRQVLKDYFGYDSFRPLQEDIISSVLNKKDTVVLMPTGGGKSLCFQVPALVEDGVCLVISPLIALMKDQVLALRTNGIAAAALNSTLAPHEAAALLRDCADGKIRILYISPEKLLADIGMLRSILKISFIAIDEAHCISSWGHDFRPEYTQLHQLRVLMPGIPLLALTATADKVTRKDIINQLRLEDPAVFIASFNRPNISLSVRSAVTGRDKMREITSFILARRDQPGIIYCMSRKSTEELAEKLRKEGISATAYHAGLSNELRDTAQEDFINDRVRIICATIAFGMGIDKSNVRWVMHYNLPKNMESYYQEIGRCGRDGQPADALLFYNVGDLVFLSKIAGESGQRELNIAKLNRIQQFAEAMNCRRKILLGYFGEAMHENCGNCDVCKNPVPLIDGTIIAQMALSAAIRTKEQVATGMLIDILRGSSKTEIYQKNFHTIKTYGAGKKYSFHEWQHYILQLLNLGVFELAYDEGFSLKVTAYGREILSGAKTILLGEAQRTVEFERVRKKREPKLKKESEPKISRKELSEKYLELIEENRLKRLERDLEDRLKRIEAGEDIEEEMEEDFYFDRRAEEKREYNRMLVRQVAEDDSLFQDLRELRLAIARRENVPPYVVFSDATLQDMVDKRPVTPEAMLHVSGIGQKKMVSYGMPFLNLIRENEKLPALEGEIKIDPEFSPKPKDKKIKTDTYAETLRLFNEGKSGEQIALERQLHPATINGHLEKLFNDGRITEPDRIIDQYIVEKVKSVLTEEPSETTVLTPIFKALDDKIPFDQIRLALAVMRKKSLVK
jgi:ATP-dependent DNA helicase RecQ